MTTKPLCFVIGPIGSNRSPERKLADMVLHGLIKPALQSDDLDVKRADEDAKPGSISQSVILDVLNADIVVADLTSFNPNAFYELGIRHSTGKPTIHICAENVVLPFDNIDQRTIFVDTADWHSIEAAREQLRLAYEAVKRPEYRDSNPISQAKGSAALAVGADDRDQQIASLLKRVASIESRQKMADAASALSDSQAGLSGLIASALYPPSSGGPLGKVGNISIPSYERVELGSVFGMPDINSPT